MQMKTLKLICPVHRKILDSTKTVPIDHNGISHNIPVFYCAECGKYYIHPSWTSDDGPLGFKLNDIPIYYTMQPIQRVMVRADTFKPDKKASCVKKTKDKDTYKDSRPKLYIHDYASNDIRVHVFAVGEESRALQSAIERLRKDYPKLIHGRMGINALIAKVFPSKLSHACVIRNQSYLQTNQNGEEFIVRRVNIYNKGNNNINSKLDDGQYLLFSGKLKQQEFIVEDIRVIENPIIKESDIESSFIFYLGNDGINHSNCLYSMTENAAEEKDIRSNEIQSWSEYLDWKNQLAQMRIQGMKYIGYNIDVRNREMVFLVVTEGKDILKDFEKYLRRNEISVFPNEYSTNRFQFQFNKNEHDYQNSEGSIPLTFINFGRHYGIDDVLTEDWDFMRRFSRKYSNHEEAIDIDYLLKGIRREYEEPYFSEIIFELTANGMATVERQLRQFGHLFDNVDETLASEFYGDGFIATSQIGDFSLIRRLKNAVNDFIAGRSVSQGLDQWLFDISKARAAENIENICQWQNPCVNNVQKRAVAKILSAPDICLIQGPPGTGKTTVIAEAIYQFVIRHKRVLVASQANLAVDNALERLISNPKIRAIRLGSARKIDSSVSNITEENVLKSFYESLIDYIDAEYVSKWNAQSESDKIRTEQVSIEELNEKEQALLKTLADHYDEDTFKQWQQIKKAIAQWSPSIETQEENVTESELSVLEEDWGSIFSDFKRWVKSIPDYSQEKDIYLKSFINGCNVVGVSCTENTRTLTEAGFSDFDVVIVDEVSKATPPELLIPMLKGKKIILVGDHRQLPPLFNEHEKTYQEVAEQQESMDDVTVQLKIEDFRKYKDMVTSSLFQRYFESADSSIKETLTTQYRMHTDIMDIVNTFYDGYLQDGNAGQYSDGRKSHGLLINSTSGTEMIVPERHAYWFDSSELAGEMVYEQRVPGSTSAENMVEAHIIIELLKKMEFQYSNSRSGLPPVSVGVISFYYDQVALIRRLIQKESFHAITVEVNTVDRFQGKEKEIIFVSLVRNVKRSGRSTDSHIAAFQRINVAFSRAQNLLIIVGARNMYAEQPVIITDMNDGTSQEVMAYKQIIQMLSQKGTFFSSDEVISDFKADEILLNLYKRHGGN